MSKHDLLIGTKVNRWFVVSKIDSKPKQQRYECICECGTRRNVLVKSLVSNASRSCGCLQRELNIILQTTHGHAGSKPSTEYTRWQNIIARCTNPKNTYYKNYGGRGITISDEWLVFQTFLNDMGKCPSDKHQIDRLDNTMGYSKQNCVWSTMADQSINKRVQIKNTSGFAGVSFRKDTRKWTATLTYKGKHHVFGCYETKEEAVKARQQAEQEYFGRIINR